MRLVTNARDVFYKIGSELKPVQDLTSLDELYDTADICNARLAKLGESLELLTGGHFILGPIKDREVAENKIRRELNGKAELLCDVVRGKLMVDSPAAILATRELLNSQGRIHRVFEEHKTRSVIVGDHFAEPKMETGYRCLNAKIAIPVVDDEELESLDINDPNELILSQTVELQVVHEDIEAIYDQTHGHMREAQNIFSRYAHERLPNVEAYRAAGHYAACKYYNGKAAREAGLDVLLADRMFALTDKQARSLKDMMRGFDFGTDPGPN